MPPQKINPNSHERSPCSTLKKSSDCPDNRKNTADTECQCAPTIQNICRCLKISRVKILIPFLIPSFILRLRLCWEAALPSFLSCSLHLFSAVGSEVHSVRILTDLQRANIRHDCPPVSRRNLRCVTVHFAPAVCHNIVEMSVRRISQTVIVIRRRLRIPAPHNHSVAFPDRTVTNNAEDFISLFAAIKQFFCQRDRTFFNIVRENWQRRCCLTRQSSSERLHYCRDFPFYRCKNALSSRRKPRATVPSGKLPHRFTVAEKIALFKGFIARLILHIVTTAET